MDATTLYTLTKVLSTQTDLDETLASVTRLAAEAFDLGGCEVLLRAADGSFESRARHGTLDNGSIVQLALTANQAQVGELRLATRMPSIGIEPTTMRLLTTFAAQFGLFIERTRLAQEAERASLLEASDQLKSALLSSVSHDLRTPLSAIKASATVLLHQDAALDADARHDLLSAINEETDRLNRLVGDLLDMSRIEAGALQLKLDWCDLDELIRAVAHRLAARMAAFHVRLDWPANLPLIYADYVQIDRVITNLLENAIRFAPPASANSRAARPRLTHKLKLRKCKHGKAITLPVFCWLIGVRGLPAGAPTATGPAGPPAFIAQGDRFAVVRVVNPGDLERAVPVIAAQRHLVANLSGEFTL